MRTSIFASVLSLVASCSGGTVDDVVIDASVDHGVDEVVGDAGIDSPSSDASIDSPSGDAGIDSPSGAAGIDSPSGDASIDSPSADADEPDGDLGPTDAAPPVVDMSGIDLGPPVPLEALCTGTGGTVATQLCCGMVPDFPDTCVIGACSCSPMFSHSVMVCACPPSTCFDMRSGCIPRFPP